MNSSSHPLAILINAHLDRSDLDRRGLGNILAENRNRSKTFHQLSEILRGEQFNPSLIVRIAEVLEISRAEIEDAVHQAECYERRAAEKRSREHRIAAMDRRGPHLWRRFPPGRHPGLVTVVGPEFFLLVPLPPDIVGLPEPEQFRIAGETAKADFLDKDRRCPHVSGYLYRRSVDAVFEFTTGGEFVRKQEQPTFDGPVSLRIGGKRIDGLQRLLARIP